MSRLGLKSIVLPLMAVSLVGCGASRNYADLDAFMTDVQNRPAVAISPLPDPAAYEPFNYKATGLRSPFVPSVATRQIDISIRVEAPDESRPKQYLEGFSIDEFTMVGFIEEKGTWYALLSLSGNVYRVKVGDYIGFNYGRIDSISENGVHVTEKVKDQDGFWTERPRSLDLQV